MAAVATFLCAVTVIANLALTGGSSVQIRPDRPTVMLVEKRAQPGAGQAAINVPLAASTQFVRISSFTPNFGSLAENLYARSSDLGGLQSRFRAGPPLSFPSAIQSERLQI
jgi:hypothetical protein